MPAMAMTDHGDIFGAIEFYQKAYSYGIKPIIGCEVYVAPTSRFEKHHQGISESSYHLILLTKNSEGYQNLNKLITKSFFEGFYYRPRIDKELLSEYSQGLIVLSGCLHGEIPSLINTGNERKALEVASEYRDIFGDRFYLEIQENGISEQKVINRGLLDINKKLGIPLVATNDCHYLKKEDSKAHEVLLCLQTGKTLQSPDRMGFSTEEFYFKSPSQMAELFSHLPQALKNTIEVAERCNLELRFGKIHFPEFIPPEGEALESFLDRKAREGLEERLAVRARQGRENFSEISQAYHKRLEEELEIIKSVGFAGYFLIVADFVNYAKKRGIPVGPGRGSAAGSLVAYALKITEIDPISYGLLFERFLNPERISPPDIDIDFCMERRDEVINYVIQKYGKENVAQIITFGKMQAKGVIRDVGRVLGLPYKEVDKIAKLVPNTLNITLEEALALEPRLKELEEKDEKVRTLLSLASSLEGLPRHASTHAAGVVISQKPLVEYLPLYRGQNGEVVTQYAMNDVEKIGLIKFDFLGLKTLTVISKTLGLIEEKLDINEIPPDDEETFKLLSRGETDGVFQLESSGMKELLTKLKSEKLEDIIALLALHRPGPLASGMVDDFIKRRHKKIPIKYEAPELEMILAETYGVILYQEQVMKIASELANFTPEEADILRRAMGKKKLQEMEEQKERFVQGAKKKGVNPKKAEKIFDLMSSFAEYGFNKSHSAAYAMIAYQTAYLKTHFPVQFMAALLTCEMGNTDKLSRHIGECREKGIEVLPPDVNKSFKDFKVEGGKIRFGLRGIKHVGESAIESICLSREESGEFVDLFDFCKRIDLRKVNKRVAESLIKCGAFDFCGASRFKLMTLLEEAISQAQDAQKGRIKGQIDMFAPKELSLSKAVEVEEWPEIELLAYEKEVLGLYLTNHPLSSYEKELKRYSNTDTVEILEKRSQREIKICGMISNLKEISTRKGDRMAFLTLEDLKGSIEVVIFPELYKNNLQILKGEEPVLIKGALSEDDERTKIVASEIIPLSQLKERTPGSIHLTLEVPKLDKDKLERIGEIFKRYPGDRLPFLHLIIPGRSETIIHLGEEFKLTPSEEMVKEITTLFGDVVSWRQGV